MSLVSTASFYDVPVTLYGNVGEFLDHNSRLALATASKAIASEEDGMWSSDAEKCRKKARAFFCCEAPEELREGEIPDHVLEYLGSKEICRIEVHATLFENFPPEFLNQLLGSVGAYFRLPQLHLRPLIESEPAYVAGIFQGSVFAIEMDMILTPGVSLKVREAQAQIFFEATMKDVAKDILPSELVDKHGQRHAMMRVTKEGDRRAITFNRESGTLEKEPLDPLIVFTTLRPNILKARVLRGKATNLLFPDRVRPQADYMPVSMSDWVSCEHGSFEFRTDERRTFIAAQGKSSTSYRNFFPDAEELHGLCVYTPFVPQE